MRRSVDAFADVLDELTCGVVAWRFHLAQHDAIDAGEAGYKFGARAL